MSNEKAAMQEAWRIGNASPEGFMLECGSEKAAAATRFALYAATKHLRDGKGIADTALREALDNCQLKLEGTKVHIRRKLSSVAAQSILDALGGTAPKTIEDYQVNESIERMMQKVAEVPEARPESNLSATARAYGARG